jgi:alkylation response protein AidB-like acyl-CoA dehydrogenase
MARPVRDAIQLTAEQHQFLELATEFAARDIRPVARAVDDAQVESPLDLWRAAAKIGLTAFMLPADVGGGGVTDLLTQARVQEELCHGDIGIGNLITSNGFYAAPILELGTAEQRERWLEPLCGDDPPLTALAVSEPDVGSDAASLRTTAVRHTDHYVLNGQKTWISNAPYAQSFVIFATVDPGSRSKGVTAFVVDRESEGLSRPRLCGPHKDPGSSSAVVRVTLLRSWPNSRPASLRRSCQPRTARASCPKTMSTASEPDCTILLWPNSWPTATLCWPLAPNWRQPTCGTVRLPSRVS